MSWFDPPHVPAPAHDDPDRSVTYAISPVYIERNAAVVRRTPVFQVWTHLVGALPPIPGIQTLARRRVTPTLTTLHDAVACFRGLARPLNGERRGESTLIYVLNPAVSIAYEPAMTCVARAVTVPPNTVLTVQVQPIETLPVDSHMVSGTVTRLEYVFSDSAESALPDSYQTRYLEKMWQRP